MRPVRGFTLVELLVAIALLAVVTLATAATLTSGWMVWQRLQAYEVQDQWVMVFFHQIRRDLSNARLFAPVGFHGEYDTLSFPALVPAGEGFQTIPEELGRIGYFFETAKQRLCRSQTPYRMVSRKGLKDSFQTVLTGIDRVRFSYYAWDSLNEGGTWADSLSSTQLPLAVKVEIQYKDASNGIRKDQSLIVYLPAGKIR